MPVGRYEVIVQKEGFASYRQGPIVLQLNQAADLRISLQVSGTMETISVTSNAPLINTTNAEIGVNFDTKRIADLPLSTNRNLMNLAASVPGVGQISNGDSPFGSSGNQVTESGGLQFAANGMRTQSNSVGITVFVLIPSVISVSPKKTILVALGGYGMKPSWSKVPHPSILRAPVSSPTKTGPARSDALL